jgi:predicted AAA+ superfamily ATPase
MNIQICYMLKKSDIKEVIAKQKEQLLANDAGYKRELINDIDRNLQNFALILSGIRRCGKSTLLHQLIEKINNDFLYLNFDTPRLFNFEIDDFQNLDSIIKEEKIKYLFFDEIHVVNGWELFVREKLVEKYDVTVTGSNATLLSKELGTKLTGRHITKELFPFSYGEFAGYKNLPKNSDSLDLYLDKGGFPEYIKQENSEILKWLVEDIIYRDIAVRNNIRDVDSLKRLLVYLVSNVSNLITASKLTTYTGIKTRATVLDYLNFFSQSYLTEYVSKFSYSYKVQMVNPRKIYLIDNGVLQEITTSSTRDNGRKLENMVFRELRILGYHLNYFNENNKECDFVASKRNKVTNLIQVCYDLNNENERREVAGLLDAMKYFNLDNGLIITHHQKDRIINKGKTIDILPAYELTDFLKAEVSYKHLS